MTEQMSELALRELLWFGDGDPSEIDKRAAESLAANVVKASGLKPFPTVAQRVLSLLAEGDVEVRTLHETLEKDPVLAARVLRVASSPLYAPSKPYVSLEQALVRLGNRTVGELVAGVAAMGVFRDAKGVGETVRTHCATVAAIARVIGTERRFRGVGRSFLAALLHDVGKLMLVEVDAFDYSTLVCLDRADECHVHERLALGYDHAALGAHVLRAWGLDESLVRVVAFHHQPGHVYSSDAFEAQVAALLRFANAIEYTFRRSRESVDDESVRALCEHEANAYVGLSAPGLAGLWPRFREADAELRAAFGA
ncbi:MAG: HDOD domain-containing protein [Sandaracinus sp.]|nr:HDOD domain-containing protein [Sandaracinus sp.]MCB9634074.1 HDOD domain-containing protein [Sandaracinus sp.]